MRLLITGASGYLGRRLSVMARDRASDGECHSGYSHHPERIAAGSAVHLDLEKGSDLETKILERAPQAIIHTAALNPRPDTEEDRYFDINATGTARVAELANRLAARLVLVSTDVLHDGMNPPYDDDASATVSRGYGGSKAAAERAVREICPDAAIVRTSLIYGLEEMDRQTRGFAERLAAGKRLGLFKDVIRQPIWIDSLSNALLALASKNAEFAGTLNVVGDQALTREAFGRRLLEWWDVPGRDAIDSVAAAEVSETPPPLDLRMSNRLASSRLGIEPPGVDDVLQIEGDNALEKRG